MRGRRGRGGRRVPHRKEGRNKLRKYGTHYQPIASNATAGEGCAEGAEVVLEYSPLYGEVPGYTKDAAISANVRALPPSPVFCDVQSRVGAMERKE